MAKRGTEQALRLRVARAAPRDHFDYPAILRGTTPHFNVYYDDTALGANGAAIADGVLATCEQDYNTMAGFFGGITPAGLPFNILIAALDPSGQGGGGAYHYGCGAVDLYCDAKTTPGLDIDYTRMLLVAEAVEVFSNAQGLGWDCGASNGEGLSRVLATELYPAELDGYSTAAAWLDTPDRPDFVNVNDPTDTNSVSTGCSVLFLNYLRYQLNYPWPQIVAAGAPTLGQTYQNLTGQPDGLTPFKALLEAAYPTGIPSGLTNDNPFPLPSALTARASGVQFRGRVPANSTVRWYTHDWPVSWHVEWIVVPTSVWTAGPQVSWSVQVQRNSSDSLTYWIAVTNTTSADVDVEARYRVSSAS